VLVAVCGLSEQNIQGMATVLDELAEHPAREEGVAHVLVMSPVPREEDLGVRRIDEVMAELSGGGLSDEWLESEQERNPLLRGLMQAQQALVPSIRTQFEQKARQHFVRAGHEDLYHELPYDPATPLRDEILSGIESPLNTRYLMLARTLARMHPSAAELDVPGMQPAPVLLPPSS
jgi:hypothetical protein